MNNNYNIGSRIKEYRTSRGFSQEELAFRAEISAVYLRQLEKNNRNPTLSVIKKLCNALSITTSCLLEDNVTAPASNADQQIIAFLSDKTENEKKIALDILRTAFKLRQG